MDLLKANGKAIANYSWTSIFDSTKDEFSRDSFTEKVYGKPNVLLVRKLKTGAIVGEYTKEGCDSKSINEVTWSQIKMHLYLC